VSPLHKYDQQNSHNLISSLTMKEMEVARLRKEKENLIAENTALQR
jgi:hypothetical protein